MKKHNRTSDQNCSWNRRGFLAAGAALAAAATIDARAAETATSESTTIVTPPEGKRILLSCKLGMITRKSGGKDLSLADRLSLAGEAGFDGVDLDQAGEYTPEQAREAVRQSGVFVHNAISHTHWKQRLTSEDPKDRDAGRASIEHCMRVSHAAGGCGMLLVIGQGGDGEPDVIEERCRQEIKKVLPLAAALGQPVLIENVWNRMFYDHDGPPEQTAEELVRFVDSFNSPWVGVYYDIGNHWKYGQPGEWIRQLGRRCVKLDVKGFSRASNKWTDIGEDDLPWDKVREALDEIGFTGWATAETRGGDLARLTLVRQQMQKAFGV
ncbi:MAG: sugar phosphate isomerase/epimerase [Pirellulaceae bacterium]|nr:sugar phosphate isomerase/epimerase [Pirellulaceae bacterium]